MARLLDSGFKIYFNILICMLLALHYVNLIKYNIIRNI